MSTHDSTSALAIVRGAFSESAAAAERQLAVIGKEHGDEALALVSRDLSPAEVFALSKDGDAAKSSIAQVFVSGDQFREAFSFFGSRYPGASAEVSRDLVDFIHPFFFEGTPEHRREMVEAFLKHPLSMKALCGLCLGSHGFVDFFKKSVAQAMAAEGWQETILLVKEVNREAFDRIRDRVLLMVDEDGDEDLGKARAFCDRLCLDLIKEARRVTGGEDQGRKAGDVFVDI